MCFLTAPKWLETLVKILTVGRNQLELNVVLEVEQIAITRLTGSNAAMDPFLEHPLYQLRKSATGNTLKIMGKRFYVIETTRPYLEDVDPEDFMIAEMEFSFTELNVVKS